jgi:hypothetical protein
MNRITRPRLNRAPIKPDVFQRVTQLVSEKDEPEVAETSESSSTGQEQEEPKQQVEQKQVKRTDPAMAQRFSNAQEQNDAKTAIRKPFQPASKVAVQKPKQPVVQLGASSQRTIRVVLGQSEVTPEAVTFASVLKQTLGLKDSPMTCLVTIAGTQDILKARNIDVNDNVVNTNLLRALTIPGFKAPAMVELAPTFSEALARNLYSQPNAPDSLIAALGSPIPAQLSEKAPGETLESLEKKAQLWNMLAGLKDKQKMDSKTVTPYLAARIKKPGPLLKQGELGNGKPIKDGASVAKGPDWDGAIKILSTGKGDPKQAITTLGWLVSDSSRAKSAPDPSDFDKDLSSVAPPLDFIKQIFSDPTVLKKIQAANQAQADLVTWLKGNEGAYAIAALATADLLFGMEDRIMGAWNGANSMFDGKALWAIDNAKSKDHNNSLTDQTSDLWVARLPTLGITKDPATITDTIYANIYVNSGYYGLQDDKPDVTKATITLALKDTLGQLAKLTVGAVLDPTVRSNLRSRLAYLGVDVPKVPEVAVPDLSATI